VKRFADLSEQEVLALAITKCLVDQQLGTITAESQGPGEGTIFSVEIPAATVTSEHLPLAPPLAGRMRRRVLLVEDHADTALALAKYLELSGFTVRAATAVSDALHLLETETFDLILSDIGLPDASGCELMQQVEKRWGLKGIAISGYGTKQDIQRSLASGFSEHIIKPLKMPQVIDSLNKLLQETHAD